MAERPKLVPHAMGWAGKPEMGSKKINRVMNHYLQEMLALYHRDATVGIHEYCLILKDLLYSSLEFLPGNKSTKKIVIEINQKLLQGVQGAPWHGGPIRDGFVAEDVFDNSTCTCNLHLSPLAEKTPPGCQRQLNDLRIHMPCIRIRDGKAKLYGYIDVLAPSPNKKEIESYPFLDLYKRLFPNLIITNFFEFFYYRAEQKVVMARPFSVSHLGALTKKSRVTNTRLFLVELQHFMDYRDKKSKDLEFMDLQQQLALKTYYLKEFILTPLLKHLLDKGIKDELLRLYRAYCYFFNQELSGREFSAFLSHLIIDGFLRAGIFYSTINSMGVKPLSPSRVYKYAKFHRMSPRRQAVFKYLAPGPEEEQLPGALPWFLVDICGFLANFDFKKMGFDRKNPMSIDGEMLQWESYFFNPYYDNPKDMREVKELLVKEGIFFGNTG